MISRSVPPKRSTPPAGQASPGCPEPTRDLKRAALSEVRENDRDNVLRGRFAWSAG
jgi:hypothetical protein